MPALELLPAIDISAGHVALAGDPGHDLGDPIETAVRWQGLGVRWVHVVDLDAAFGRGHNRDLVRRVVQAVHITVEVAGGVDDQDALTAALSTGARRVAVSARALADLDWCVEVAREYGDRVAFSIDVRGDRVVPRGGRLDDFPADLRLVTVLDRLDSAGARCYVVTDVTRDGALGGPNLDLLRTVADQTAAQVIASGGVSTLDDLRALRRLVSHGVSGAIIGSALHTGQLDLAEALRVTQAGGMG